MPKESENLVIFAQKKTKSLIKNTLQWQHSEKCLKYVIYRWMYFLFYTFSFINSIVFSIQRNQLMLSLIYLTRWNLFATVVASSLSAYFTTQHYCGKFKNRMSVGLKIYWFTYNSVPVYAIYISLIYWLVLYDGKEINLNNFLTHGTNCIGPLIDLMIVNHPYCIAQSIFPMICAVFYSIFTYAYQQLGGVNFNGDNFVYPILDWDRRPMLALTVAVTAVFCGGLFHMFFCAVIQLRIKIHAIMNSDKNLINHQQSSKYHVVECAEV